MHKKEIEFKTMSFSMDENKGIFARLPKTGAHAVDLGCKQAFSRGSDRIFGQTCVEGLKRDIVQMFNAGCTYKYFRLGARSMLERISRKCPVQLHSPSQTEMRQVIPVHM